MDPLTIGMITGGANLLGGIFSANTSAENTQANIAAQQQMQNQTEAFNAQEAEKNRVWQQQMSSTAYQRAQADMKAAGLNPILAAGGSGASTPSGSTASVGSPNMALSQKTSPFANLGDAVNKVVSSAVQAKTLDKMTEEIGNLKATGAKIAAETASEAERPAEIAARAGLTSAQEAKTREETVNTKIEREIVGNQATKALHERELREKYPWIDQVDLSGRTASNVIAPFVSSAPAARKFMPDRWFW